MSDTDAVLNQALAAIDAEDADIVEETNNDEGKGDDKDTTDANASKPEPSKDDKQSADTGDSQSEDEDKKPADKAAETDGEGEPEGEFTADDALEVEDTKPAQTAPVDQAGIALSQDEQKYIVDNIGDPLVLNGYKLDKDGNQVEYQVKAYSPRDLPRDFNFVTDGDRLQATDAFNRLEQKANNLVQEKRQEQSRAAAADFERRENESIRADVAELQKEGRMAKFRVKPGSVGFDEDPAAQVMDEVLKIMAAKNAQYLDDHNTKGRAYRHIGFEQAFDIYERTNPQRQQARKVDAAQDAEDKARKTKAERGDSNRGDAIPNIMKATVKSGTTTRDLMAMLDAEEL